MNESFPLYLFFHLPSPPSSLSLSLPRLAFFFFSPLSPPSVCCSRLTFLICEFLSRTFSRYPVFSHASFPSFLLFLVTSHSSGTVRFTFFSSYRLWCVFPPFISPSPHHSHPPPLNPSLLHNLRRNIFSRNVRVHLLLS